MIHQSTEDRIKQCITKHPEWTDARIANSLITSIWNIRAVRAGKPLPLAGPITDSAVPILSPQPESGLVSLDKVIHRYDFRAAIYRELALIPRGKLISEAELCQRVAGTDRNRFRRTVENNEAEFRPLRILLKLDEGEKKWYWADKETIEAAQRIRDL